MCRPVYFLCLYCGARAFFMWEECKHFWARYHQVVFEQGDWEGRPRVSRSVEEPPECGGGIQHHHDREAPLGRCPMLRDCPSMEPYISLRMTEYRSPFAGNQGDGVPMTEQEMHEFVYRRSQWIAAIDSSRQFRWPTARVPVARVPQEGARMMGTPMTQVPQEGARMMGTPMTQVPQEEVRMMGTPMTQVPQEGARMMGTPMTQVPQEEARMMGTPVAAAAVAQDTMPLPRRQDEATAPNCADDADDEKGKERGLASTVEQETQGQLGMQSAEDMANDSEDGIPPESLLLETTAPMLHLSSYQQPTAGAESLSLSHSNIGVESDSNGSDEYTLPSGPS